MCARARVVLNSTQTKLFPPNSDRDPLQALNTAIVTYRASSSSSLPPTARRSPRVARAGRRGRQRARTQRVALTAWDDVYSPVQHKRYDSSRHDPTLVPRSV